MQPTTKKIISEKWLSKQLRAKLPAYGVQVYSFENCGIQDVPDLHTISPRKASWLELKVVETENCQIPYRRGQTRWLHDYVKTGGGHAMVIVLVRKPVVALWRVVGDFLRSAEGTLAQCRLMAPALPVLPAGECWREVAKNC